MDLEGINSRESTYPYGVFKIMKFWLMVQYISNEYKLKKSPFNR